MTEKEFDELIKKACEQIAEKEYKEDMRKAKEMENKIHFSKEHEKKMKKIFKDIAEGKTPKV